MAYPTAQRQQRWQTIDQTPQFDVLVIGGGITGAGIAREAARAGLQVLLCEARDFAYGTSSRSSKMVHGGLRYLKQGQLGLMYDSVRERQRLLQEGAGLVEPLGFLIPRYDDDKATSALYHIGLTLYDLMALQWTHRTFNANDFERLAPHIPKQGLRGGFRFGDAQTDDARLVLRVLHEAQEDGALVMNYAAVNTLMHEGVSVVGAQVWDDIGNQTHSIRAKVVINATGAWADVLRQQVGGEAKMRPLRGSHLIFPAWRFPLAQALSFQHPLDKRPVFAFPWEGVTLVGTTDVDHELPLEREPRITGEEVAYLMAALAEQFPSLHLTLEDVLSSYAGVRPVIGTGKAAPSKEVRDHVVWQEQGLLTVTGGKLTTFRVIALDALRAVQAIFPDLQVPDEDSASALNPVTDDLPPAAERLNDAQRRRLLGRYGADAPDLVRHAASDTLTPIPTTQTLWAELAWSAAHEGVMHLEDLLLRRTRLGLLLPEGGAAHLPRIRALCQTALAWDDARWEEEQSAYLQTWHSHYSLPPHHNIPDWRPMLAEHAQQHAKPKLPVKSQSSWLYGLGVMLIGGALWYWWHQQIQPSPKH